MSKQLIVELDPATAADLERVAPTRTRQRSAFVRQALRSALDAALEERMAAAYRRRPDAAEPWAFDPEAWTEPPVARRRARHR